MNNFNPMHIDAQGKSFGRLASYVARLLQEKNLPSYTPDRMPQTTVIVENIEKVRWTGQKLRVNRYRATRYPGGIKTMPLGQLFDQFPERIFRDAVRRMLPDNRRRDSILHHLTIKRS